MYFVQLHKNENLQHISFLCIPYRALRSFIVYLTLCFALSLSFTLYIFHSTSLYLLLILLPVISILVFPVHPPLHQALRVMWAWRPPTVRSEYTLLRFVWVYLLAGFYSMLIRCGVITRNVYLFIYFILPNLFSPDYIKCSMAKIVKIKCNWWKKMEKREILLSFNTHLSLPVNSINNFWVYGSIGFLNQKVVANNRKWSINEGGGRWT